MAECHRYTRTAKKADQRRVETPRQCLEAENMQRSEQHARVLAASGRTPTGEHTTLMVVSTRRMDTATTREVAFPLGTVLRLDDGRRGVVIEREVGFTG